MKLNHSSPEIFFNQQTEMCANTEDTSTKNKKHQTNRFIDFCLQQSGLKTHQNKLPLLLRAHEGEPSGLQHSLLDT